MHLRSITLKGFKSFPDRTRLEFSPGVSVIVGPNGSGKSNITDAVLWALGEQSPLAVRGQTMQDVLFAGGPGLPSRAAAEVEVVIDNSDGGLASEFSELAIARRLERSGEGEYRLNGARCRLVDVLEALSETGLGREMHSVVSQGKVESIVHSRPRDRRLLIEEAAGLGKHRRRRRRAELKLARTATNLTRAHDVEREARSRLRPLKRQAEAAELHERLERQSLEARLGLAVDSVGSLRTQLVEAEGRVRDARSRSEGLEAEFGAISTRREAAEDALAGHSSARDALSGRLFAARSAADAIALRLERARDTERAARSAAARRRAELEAIEELPGRRPGPSEGAPAPEEEPHERIRALEAELAGLESADRSSRASELAELERRRSATATRHGELERAVAERRQALAAAEAAASDARAARTEAQRQLEEARRRAAEVGAELAAVGHFLGSAAPQPEGARRLSDELRVESGYEFPVAAVLGALLGASLAGGLEEAGGLLDRAGAAGGSALVVERPAPRAAGDEGTGGRPPLPGAQPLLERVQAAAGARHVAERLLGDAWLVPSLEGLAAGFAGVAVTRSGRVLFGRTGEVRQAPSRGAEMLLEEGARREALLAESEQLARAEAAARARAEERDRLVARSDAAHDSAERALKQALHELGEAATELQRLDRPIAALRESPEHGPRAVRRAQLIAELQAERRLAERAEREREEREARRAALEARIRADEELARSAERAIAALERARGAVAARRDALESELEADEAVAGRIVAELRGCAEEEARLKDELRRAAEAVTQSEVAAQRLRDAAAEAAAELDQIADRLGVEADPLAGAEPLSDDERAELAARIERVRRRRELLGPINPLAQSEYRDLVDHVEELEGQRRDLESALNELETLIRDVDRRIRESFDRTFAETARNFEDVIGHLFPGGRGRLRLLAPEAPRLVGHEGRASLAAEAAGPGGHAVDGAAAAEPGAAAGFAEPDDGPLGQEAAEEGPGVEVEVTPAGKSMKRLSLLSGGEKSLVALAFLLAVFLTRPCPFYILDEVEAALDDANIDRFLQLIRRYSERAQFIVVTHQRRTMDAADCLYGVTMGADGVSKVVSRRLPAADGAEPAGEEAAAAA